MNSFPLECEMVENSSIVKQNNNDVSRNFHHSIDKLEQGFNSVNSSDLADSVALLNDKGTDGIGVNLSGQAESNNSSINKKSLTSLSLISELKKGPNSDPFCGPLHQNFPAVAKSVISSLDDGRAQKDCTGVNGNFKKEADSCSVEDDSTTLKSAPIVNEKVTSSSNSNMLYTIQRNNNIGEVEGLPSLESPSLNMKGENVIIGSNVEPMSISSLCESIEQTSDAINYSIEPDNSSPVKDIGRSDSSKAHEVLIIPCKAVSDLSTAKDNIARKDNIELTQTEGHRSRVDSGKFKMDNTEGSDQQIPPVHFVPEANLNQSTRQSRCSLLHRDCKSPKKPKPDIQGIGIREFNCGVCRETFAQRLLLKKHIAESHEGRLNLSVDRDKLSNDVTFICPICKAIFTRKHGLKRHFSNKHSSVKSICCPECKEITKNLQEYLNHAVIHTLVVTAESPLFRIHKVPGSQLKCRECHQIFQNNDTLRLHVLNHNMIAALSQAEPSHLSSLQNDASSNTHALNSDQPSEAVNGHTQLNQTVLSDLKEELKSTVEQSLDTASKVISRMDCLTCSVRSKSSSVSIMEKFFPALNFISSLSSGLSSLSSALGQILLTESLMNAKAEDLEKTKNDVQNRSVFQSPDGEGCEGESSHDGHARCKDESFTTEGAEVEYDNHADDGDEMNVILPQVKNKKNPKRGRRKVKSSRKVCSIKKPHDHICPQCRKEFKNCVNLARHSLIHKDQRPYKCKLCKLGFHRSSHLKRHMLTHVGNRPLKCDSCDFTAKSAKAMHTHSLLHGQDQSFPCEKCDFVGRTPYELSRHKKKHNPCPLCSYISADAADYKMHKRSHLNFICTDCNYSCRSSWQLRRHAKKHNPASKDQQKYCCELCGYSCFEKRHFDYHMARHENRTPFSCPDCDYKCSSRTSFDAHKLMHAGLKPFLCTTCGASFRRTSSLNQHMLIHKDEKKHVCLTCGHPFRSSYNLKIHEMTHTGEKQFKCHLCNFACRRNKELRLHLERHKSPGQTDDHIKPLLPEDIKDDDLTSST